VLFQLIADPLSGAAGPGATFADTGTFRFASYEDANGNFLDPTISGSAVPEPSSIILIALGVPAIGIATRRRFARVA
jgi:hypothetical protein